MIHLVGLPHTGFDDVHFSSCAFTAKAVRLARMLRGRGIDVTVYWGGDKADVEILTVDEQIQYFGIWNSDDLPSLSWDASLSYWQVFHQRVIDEIAARIEPGDIVAVVGGSVSQNVIDWFSPTHTCIEPGVGYEGLARDTFVCFESYAWMHNRYGAYGIGDGRSFDTVIPNAVDPNEWYLDESEGYALFVGRLIHRKGPHVAAQIANAAGLKLVVAGAGAAHAEANLIVAQDGTRIEGHVHYIGTVSGEARRRLFAKAEVLICPTLYIGPWEGVHAEAMMSGVPVVAPDYGVFTETLPREHRYRSISEAVNAIKEPAMRRGEEWRRYADSLCGIDRCADLYTNWFDALMSLRDGRNGWYR